MWTGYQAHLCIRGAWTILYGYYTIFWASLEKLHFKKKLLLEAEDVVLCFKYWARHAQFNGLLVFDFQWHLGEFFLFVFLRTLELYWLIVFPRFTWILFALSVNDVYLNVRTYKIYEKDIKYIYIFHKSSTDCQWHWSFKS